MSNCAMELCGGMSVGVWDCLDPRGERMDPIRCQSQGWRACWRAASICLRW